MNDEASDDEQVDRIAQDAPGGWQRMKDLRGRLRLAGTLPRSRRVAAPGGTPQSSSCQPVLRPPAVAAERGAAGVTAGDGAFATVDECVAGCDGIAFHCELNEALLANCGTRSSRPSARRCWREGDRLAEDRLARDGPGPSGAQVSSRTGSLRRRPRARRPCIRQTVTGDDGLTLMEWAPFGVIWPPLRPRPIRPARSSATPSACSPPATAWSSTCIPGAVECSLETVRPDQPGRRRRGRAAESGDGGFATRRSSRPGR
jgi:hypothetical protein